MIDLPYMALYGDGNPLPVGHWTTPMVRSMALLAAALAEMPRTAMLRACALVPLFVFDLLACLLLLYFGVWHVTMIRTNRTSLEPPNEERYDVGVSANVRQVMGQKRWLWPLPVWLDDGPHAELEWPLAEGEPRHDRD